MTDQEFVLSVYPDAKVYEGDAFGSRIIMCPGEFLSAEFPENMNSSDENYATDAAWADARLRIENTVEGRENV